MLRNVAEAGLDRKMVSLFLFPSFPSQHCGCGLHLGHHLVQETIPVRPNLWPIGRHVGPNLNEDTPVEDITQF